MPLPGIFCLEGKPCFQLHLFLAQRSQMHSSFPCRATEISSFNLLHPALPEEIATFLFLWPYSLWIGIANRVPAPCWFAQWSQQTRKKNPDDAVLFVCNCNTVSYWMAARMPGSATPRSIWLEGPFADSSVKEKNLITSGTLQNRLIHLFRIYCESCRDCFDTEKGQCSREGGSLFAQYTVG